MKWAASPKNKRGAYIPIFTGGELEGDGGLPEATQYLAQLYYKISRIDWDYECELPLIRGVHHGSEIAQPINLDTSQHSRCFVSDYLWSMVDTTW
uniref:Kinetochore protein Spc24 n=1 Tax=Sphenodon punctatus TaxID=8508 RepID=A0A8D0L230_SPHPU